MDSKVQDYMESNIDHIKSLFRIAGDHRITYMSLNENAMELCKPIIEDFKNNKQYDECIKWLCKNTPDCIDRLLIIKQLMDLEKEVK